MTFLLLRLVRWMAGSALQALPSDFRMYTFLRHGMAPKTGLRHLHARLTDLGLSSN